MDKKLKEISEKLHSLEEEMSRPEVISDQNRFRALNKERSDLAPIVNKYEESKELKAGLKDSTELLGEEKDDEMKELIQLEIDELTKKVEKCDDELMVLLIPKDPNAGKDVIVEIRAGTGGDEAALFAADLYRMYQRYVELKGWKFELIEANYTEIGGYKEIIFSAKGDEAFENLKYESGVHRVQRVPSTESGGRLHTSAVTVAVLAEAEEADFEIAPDDVRVDVYRASGHGGQSVNTTDSAVRLTHVPTGMIVTCQDEKSQHKNKAKAMRVLRSRLLEKMTREKMAKESKIRKSQIGSGDRSERIRTYNFPQSRVTDHRIGLSIHSLESFLAGEMDEVTNALKEHEVNELLKVVQE
ncbi:peptide chain release factor 1 [Spirochaetota bacterium]